MGKTNITLIGMPGAGKSTVGVVLAKKLCMDFVDGDLEIQRKMRKTLSEIIEERGNDGFREVESDILASLLVTDTVIAPGGSVCYEPTAMEHLQEISRVIYLKLSLEEIANRLGDLKARGVTFAEGQTLADLYAERTPLYEKYADITLDCEGLALREVVERIQRVISAA